MKWENWYELYIGLFMEEIWKYTCEDNSPLVFWYYYSEQRDTITNMSAKKIFQLQGQNYHRDTFRYQGDILYIYKFGWYKWVDDRDRLGPFPQISEFLGPCMEPENNEGN